MGRPRLSRKRRGPRLKSPLDVSSVLDSGDMRKAAGPSAGPAECCWRVDLFMCHATTRQRRLPVVYKWDFGLACEYNTLKCSWCTMHIRLGWWRPAPSSIAELMNWDQETSFQPHDGQAKPTSATMVFGRPSWRSPSFVRDVGSSLGSAHTVTHTDAQQVASRTHTSIAPGPCLLVPRAPCRGAYRMVQALGGGVCAAYR